MRTGTEPTLLAIGAMLAFAVTTNTTTEWEREFSQVGRQGVEP